MNGAEVILECLKKEGVDLMFGYPGGVVLTFYDKLNQQKEIRHILVRNEQGASFAADGYARASGKVGVCMATSGPGATNLITGIANAHLDSIPMVAFSGQVASGLIGSDAFQEVDMVGICQPITKQVYQIFDAEDIPRIIKEAFYIARNGRPGPVLIDVPKDIFEQEVGEWEYPAEVDLPGFKPNIQGNHAQIKKACELISRAKKPVILAGHGIVLGNAEEEFKELVDKMQAPVISTLLAMDLIPKKSHLNLGMLGMHGQLSANLAVHNSDLVLGIGLRFDDRILGKIDDFAPNAKIIHIDIDRAEIGKNRAVDVPIVGDVKKVLPEIIKEIKPSNHKEWIEQLYQWNREKEEKLESSKTEKMSARDVVKMISRLTEGKAVVVADVGQNQMWTANYYEFESPRNHLSSGGLGSMGYSLPASMGACLARPNETTVAIMGDGGFQMNSQELMTLVQDDIDVKVVILNNGYLGMVRQWQELFFKKNYSYTPMMDPNFVKLSEAYGIPAERAETLEEAEKAFQNALNHKGAYLVEMVTESEENVFPMVAPGTSLKETRLK